MSRFNHSLIGIGGGLFGSACTVIAPNPFGVRLFGVVCICFCLGCLVWLLTRPDAPSATRLKS